MKTKVFVVSQLHLEKPKGTKGPLHQDYRPLAQNDSGWKYLAASQMLKCNW